MPKRRRGVRRSTRTACLLPMQHDSSQRGRVNCIDLRPWCEKHRYRFRYEDSYKAERDPETGGDGSWYVEVLCRRGLIYPWGADDLCPFTTSGHAWTAL